MRFALLEIDGEFNAVSVTLHATEREAELYRDTLLAVYENKNNLDFKVVEVDEIIPF